MIHSIQTNMLDEMMSNPDELFVSSNFRHCVLYSTTKDAVLFLEGDFSGTLEECEAEARRLLSTLERHTAPLMGRRPPEKGCDYSFELSRR